MYPVPTHKKRSFPSTVYFTEHSPPYAAYGKVRVAVSLTTLVVTGNPLVVGQLRIMRSRLSPR